MTMLYVTPHDLIQVFYPSRVTIFYRVGHAHARQILSYFVFFASLCPRISFVSSAS